MQFEKHHMVLALATGNLIGVFATSFALKKSFNNYVVLTDKQYNRQNDTSRYLFQKMSPHVPDEVLEDIIVYYRTALMAAEEEGIEMGVLPIDE